MRAFRFPALLLGLASAATLFAAENRDEEREAQGARERGGGDRRGPSVTFYEHADFRGASFTLGPGEAVDNLTRLRFSNGADANDRISSIRIEGGLTVLVYRDARFRGGVLRLTHDVRNFAERERDWNDTISSIRVEGFPGRPPGPGRPEREDPARFDQIIDRAFHDILLRAADESGLRSYRRRMIDDHWTEQQVRAALRSSEEFREVADRIVAKVYRELLGREPDAGGGKMFRDRIVRDNWTEEDVRNAVRKSPEYREHRSHP